MKNKLLQYWPIITFLAPLVGWVIYLQFQMHTDIILLSTSLDNKFNVLQMEIQTLQQKEDMRFSFDERELNEVKSAQIKLIDSA